VTSKRGIGLRVVLAGLAVAIVVPVGLVAALIVLGSWRQQMDNVDRQNVETARAISIAIDQEIQNTITALNLIAALEIFDTTATTGFEELARRLVPSEPGWHALLLADQDGEPLLNTAAVPGEPLPDLDWARQTLETGEPAVSNILKRPDGSGYFVIASVPVIRDGDMRYVLGAQVRTDAFTRVLGRQHVSRNGVITLLDRNKLILARTRNQEKYIGNPPTAGFRAAAERMSEGAWREEMLLEGVPAYAALSRSTVTGWTIGVGLPASEIDGPMRRSLWALLAVALIALGAAAGLAAWFTSTFERSFNAASRTAMALARSEPSAMPPSRIREINVLGSGLSAAAATLQARLEERDQAERLKDEFLMTLSHELRTPLTAITGWSRMLSTGQIRAGQEPRAIGSIERNASALTQLVDDLLDVSRSVSGKLRLDLQPVEVSAVAHAAIEAVRPAADAKSIEIHTSFDPAASMVLGDTNRLRQIVWNLLSNAVKFTPGGGAVRVTVTRVTRSDRRDDRSSLVEIRVSDTGPGIDPAFMPFIFDRFRQGSAGPSRPHGGLGLGLAIVRQLVELHGGTVECRNNHPEPGASFRVQLPAVAGAIDRRMAAAAAGAADAPIRLDGVSVLVVDDDPQARELFASILELAGAEVRAAAAVDDAIFLLHAWSPAVLLSDIEMPNEDGHSLLRRLSSLPGARPVAVAVTAHARPEDRVHALEAGFQWHLGKPVDPAELLSVIATLLSATPAADTGAR
jgi:signal transduction histidine kinase/ActR/RegA family two-component response regulator